MHDAVNPPQEELLWEGPSSHVRNFWLNVGCWLFCWLIVPLFIWFWKWLELRCRVYRVTSERLRVTQGIFSKRSDELELYRVRDLTFVQPFLYRMFNKGDIVLTTTDTTTPVVTLECLPANDELRDGLRRAVEACRDRKRARVAELGFVDGDVDEAHAG